MLVMPESAPNNADAVPDGFELLQVGGGYFKQLGPVYGKTLPDGSMVVALRVAERHLNFGGVAHGGMLTTVADGALGRNVASMPPCATPPKLRCRSATRKATTTPPSACVLPYTGPSCLK